MSSLDEKLAHVPVAGLGYTSLASLLSAGVLEGTTPRKAIKCLGFSDLVKSPSSATETPRTAITGAIRQYRLHLLYEPFNTFRLLDSFSHGVTAAVFTLSPGSSRYEQESYDTVEPFSVKALKIS